MLLTLSLWTILFLTVNLLFGNTIVHSFDGGTHPKKQLTLCHELILPAGYPCSEYTVLTHYFPLSILEIILNCRDFRFSSSLSVVSFCRFAKWWIILFDCFQTQTKDGFLLGLQRVSSSPSSSSLRRGYAGGERGSPVLLLHGLFMVTTAFSASC